jgi:DNA-binding NtrC family response regulator
VVPPDPAEVTSLAGARVTRKLPDNLRILVVSGPDRGQAIKVREGKYLIGKAADCALVLSDPLVSRQHLEVVVSPDSLQIRDLRSKNGSYFEGARFEAIVVGVGASIVLGESELKVTTSDVAAQVPPSEADHFGELLGTSLAMRQIFTILERVAASDSAVLLQGETGTGKDLAAEAIHAASARHQGPFVVCDLAGIPMSLIESDLFGHVRGSFTGADRDREGAFVQADGGTIFLDEVGELDMEVQPRLLRALERRQVKPVGGTGYRTVNVRVIAATNRDLQAEVRAGRFRRDLFHRLAVVRVDFPPLRQRRQDVPLLVDHFLRLAAAASGRPPPTVPPETLDALTAHDWPGNVRELRNVLEHAVSLASAESLDPVLLGFVEGTASSEGGGSPRATTSLPFKEAKDRLVEAWEREYLAELLNKAGGNVSLAARRGGISRVYLHELMKKHGIR